MCILKWRGNTFVLVYTRDRVFLYKRKKSTSWNKSKAQSELLANFQKHTEVAYRKRKPFFCFLNINFKLHIFFENFAHLFSLTRVKQL